MILDIGPCAKSLIIGRILRFDARISQPKEDACELELDFQRPQKPNLALRSCTRKIK